MKYIIKNLIFEGGGVKGIAYVGALRELENRGVLKQIQRVGGTSAGAINAVLMALGYSLKETRQVLSKLDFNNFLDDSWGIIRDAKRLVKKYGWYKGDFFHNWISDLIEKKTGNPNSTFNDLKADPGRFLELYLVGSNLSTGYSEVFSGEHTPRMRIADAVRISMSIPLFFTAVRDSQRNDVYVDGGVFSNYPIKLFDREKYVDPANLKTHVVKQPYYDKANSQKPKTSSGYVYNKETLGFRLDNAQEIAQFRDGAEPQHNKIENFFDYVFSLISSVLNVQNNLHLHSDDWQRTVYIDTVGVKTTQFDLSEAKKRELEKEGQKGTKKYFDWYDSATGKDLPANHPQFKLKP